jgi:[acyl-carrier-protein] S-malonyltransferase
MKLAFVFPGQGSQSVGMMGELGATYPVVTETFAEASEVLGYDLWALVQEGPEELLNQTHRTQPAMLAAGVAVWRAWRSRTSLEPSLLAGHSLGEYTALVCADALDFRDAVKLVAQRGEFMQQAVPVGQGAMAAILGLDDAEVLAACDQVRGGDVVDAVNFNAPGQVVIAGGAAAVGRAIERAKAAGAKRAVLLPVSVPSHCALMKPAAQRLAEALEAVAIRTPRIPVLHNADVASHSAPEEIADALVRQLYMPVRWVETVRHVAGRGVTTVVESGPGKVLTGLNKRIAREVDTLAVFDVATLDHAVQALAIS